MVMPYEPGPVGPRLDRSNCSDCGWDVDWSAGLTGLPRAPDRPVEASQPLLTKLIEGEIIPRLFLAHNSSRPGIKKRNDFIPLEDTDAFARLVLTNEPSQIVDQVEQLLERGVTLERIYLDMLAPVARLLGVLWEEDRCTFTDVTLGLARLHQVLHEIGRRDLVDTQPRRNPRKAYLVPSPGEQHTFGLSMLEEFFSACGLGNRQRPHGF